MRQPDEIRRVIARTRRRLRFQLALEWSTAAIVPAVAGATTALWAWRMTYLSSVTATVLAVGAGALVLLSAIAGALRRLPAQVVAARLDRASGLASRLGTAWDFADRLAESRDSEPLLHPSTAELMRRAVEDGVRAAERADVRAAAPIRAPRDARTAAVFAFAAGLVLLLDFGPERGEMFGVALLDWARKGQESRDRDAEQAISDDDLDYSRELAVEMRRRAEEAGDDRMKEMAREIEALLDEAREKNLSKAQLLARLEAIENKYLDAKENDVSETLRDLKETGKELRKEPLTRELGEALAAGDLDRAEKEIEKLAGKLEKNELTERQEKQLAEALEKMEKARQERRRDEEQRAQEEIQRKREEVRRLKRELEKHPDEPKAAELRRRLQKEERELERLERDRQEMQQARRRKLERLHRNLQKTAENLRNRRPEASRSLRDAARDAAEIEDEIRKIENQKKQRSQLADLKDALRRAKPRRGQGLARAQRLRDFQERAGGGQGTREAWRPGQRPGLREGGRQGQGQTGQGHEGQGHHGQGQQPGDSYGDGHDPNLMGDPTARYGKTVEQRLRGAPGQGPSRRETILTAAKRGFATTSYKKVYAEYQKIVEEVMNAEKVPQGYKYYVKRYFQRIKPYSMD